MNSELYKVNNIRDNIFSRNIGLDKCGGVYKWWCDYNTFEELFNMLKVDFKLIELLDLKFVETIKIENDTLYCFYVGKANTNLRKRIKSLHIGKRHKKNPSLGHAINSSTLRRSINALKNGSRNFDEEYVDKILDDCYVQWEIINGQINIDEREKEEINSHIRLLNIDDFEQGKPFSCYRDIIKIALKSIRQR